MRFSVGAAPDGLEAARWRLVRLSSGGERAAEGPAEPETQDVEYHGQVGGNYGREGFTRAPCCAELAAVDGFLVMKLMSWGLNRAGDHVVGGDGYSPLTQRHF